MTLGSERIEFGPNRAGGALVLSAGLFLGAIAILGVSGGRDMVAGITIPIGIVASICLILAVRTFSSRAVLDDFGITYSSMFSHKRMLWSEVDRFYYRATRQSINFVPVGTYYWYRLFDLSGNKLSIGSRISSARNLGECIIRMTHDPLFAKKVEEYNLGRELDFGCIRLSRESGIWIKRTLGMGWRRIPLSEVAQYRIDSGQVYVFRVGQKRCFGTPIGRVPNCFVLLSILNAIFRPDQTSPAT